MNKKMLVLIGIVMIILLAGGIFWYSNKVQYGSVVSNLTPVISPDSGKDQLPLSWDRVTEIVEKSHHVNVIGDVPEGVTKEEYLVATRMELARLNSIADGNAHPWFGSFGLYDGRMDNVDGSPVDKDLIENVRQGYYGFKLSWELTPNSNSIKNGHTFELEINENSTCVFPKDSLNERREFKCFDADKPGLPQKKALSGTAQVYGLRNGNQIKVSKIIIIHSAVLYPGSQFDNLQ